MVFKFPCEINNYLLNDLPYLGMSNFSERRTNSYDS